MLSYEYQFGKEVNIYMRPGLLRFLQSVSGYYEVVIFGDEDTEFIMDTFKKLNYMGPPIQHVLGRDATRYEKGNYVKDLRFLNRSMRKIICIDYDPEHVKYSLRNSIIIPKFDADPNDKELLQLVQFLKDMSSKKVTDVREELDKYGNFKPHINYYKTHKKYKNLLPPEEREGV